MATRPIDEQQAQALVRFGLGRRGVEDPPSDPPAWLTGQLDGPDPAIWHDLPTTAEALLALRQDRQEKPPPAQSRSRRIFLKESSAQVGQAIDTSAPFRERLVWFWANHFTVSRRVGGCAVLAGAFVREAIRPHVTGRFADMVLAVMRHPAMLIYLSNAGSVGPDSLAGRRRHRGLNENLARECMELHTVSPAAGYTQNDVIALARILTGWSIDLRADPPGFVFRPRAHEPGEQILMGRRFPGGEEGGIAALRFLADHPATHRHLATKLAAHFCADDPAPKDVAAIEAVLRDTGGDLGSACRALIALPSAWRPFGKLRSPQDYAIAVLRALDLPQDRRPNPVGALAGLGQPLWNAPLPNGWPDSASDWASPDGLLRRVDWTYGLSAHAGDLDAEALAEANLGPLLRPATLHQIRHAGSRRDALTMLLSSPEFLRR